MINRGDLIIYAFKDSNRIALVTKDSPLTDQEVKISELRQQCQNSFNEWVIDEPNIGFNKVMKSSIRYIVHSKKLLEMGTKKVLVSTDGVPISSLLDPKSSIHEQEDLNKSKRRRIKLYSRFNKIEYYQGLENKKNQNLRGKENEIFFETNSTNMRIRKEEKEGLLAKRKPKRKNFKLSETEGTSFSETFFSFGKKKLTSKKIFVNKYCLLLEQALKSQYRAELATVYPHSSLQEEAKIETKSHKDQLIYFHKKLKKISKTLKPETLEGFLT